MITKIKIKQSKRDPVSLYVSYHSFKKVFRTNTFLVIRMTKKSTQTTAVEIASMFILYKWV